MKIIEIILATIMIFLMRNRIMFAACILFMPKSWVLEAMRKTIKEASHGA